MMRSVLATTLVASVIADGPSQIKGKNLVCFVDQETCDADLKLGLLISSCQEEEKMKNEKYDNPYYEKWSNEFQIATDVQFKVNSKRCSAVDIIKSEVQSDSISEADAKTLIAEAEARVKEWRVISLKGDDVCKEKEFKNSKLCGGTSEYTGSYGVTSYFMCGFKKTKECEDVSKDFMTAEKAESCMPIFTSEHAMTYGARTFSRVAEGETAPATMLYVLEEDWYTLTEYVSGEPLRKVKDAAALGGKFHLATPKTVTSKEVESDLCDGCTDRVYTTDEKLMFPLKDMLSCSTKSSIPEASATAIAALPEAEQPSIDDLHWTIVPYVAVCNDDRYYSSVYCMGVETPDAAPLVGAGVAAAAVLAAIALRA